MDSSHAIHTDIELAKHVQKGLLDIQPSTFTGIQVARQSIAADKIGGDFFIFNHKEIPKMAEDHQLPGVMHYNSGIETTITIGIGDVAGHGVASALVMALSMGLFSDVINEIKEPKNAFDTINERLREFISSTQIPYITAALLLIQPQSQRIYYSQAGHHPTILLSKKGEIKMLDCPGSFLGMYPDECYSQESTEIKSGDRILLYTDGISEASSPKKIPFGQDQVIDHLMKTQQTAIQTVIDSLFLKLKSHQQSNLPIDDQTAILIEIT